MQRVKIITSREIGESIKRRRKELGISQERLSEVLGVSYQQVQRYESGANKLNVENLQEIANFLAVPVASFFGNGHELNIVETSPSCMPAEEKALLKHFRRIKVTSDKLLVVSFARLAAR